MPEQEDVAAEDIEVRFVGWQPNRLREVLEGALGGIRFSETHLAAVLPRLPETGARATGRSASSSSASPRPVFPDAASRMALIAKPPIAGSRTVARGRPILGR